MSVAVDPTIGPLVTYMPFVNNSRIIDFKIYDNVLQLFVFGSKHLLKSNKLAFFPLLNPLHFEGT